MIFEVNDFLKGVVAVKTFWLSSLLNELRIEAHKDTKRMDFISIDRDSGLETVVTVPAYVAEDTVLYAKTINSFYKAVKLLQERNVGKNNPLKLRLVSYDKQHFSIEVLLTHQEFAASTKRSI